MARLRLTQNVNGSSTWRTVAGTKEDVAAELRAAVRDGTWPTLRFEGREEVVLNPACVMWVEDD
jgi:hypothetical protein